MISSKHKSRGNSMRNEMNKMRRKIGMKAEMHALRIMVKTMLI